MKKRIKDETGERYGRLTVISFAYLDKKMRAYWNCQCDCGNSSVVIGTNLRNGDTKSCGCLMRDTTREANYKKVKYIVPYFSAIYSEYQEKADKTNMNFELTPQQFYDITQKNCYYCDSPPLSASKGTAKGASKPFIYNGIDRVDNNRGYILENCVPCCFICNIMKRNYNVLDFLYHINRISSNLKLSELDWENYPNGK